MLSEFLWSHENRQFLVVNTICCLGLILHYFRRSPTLSKTAGPRVPGPPQKVCPAVLKLPMKCILLEGIPLVNIPYVGDGSRFNVPSNPARSRASPVTSKCEIPSVGRRDLGEANVRPLAWGEVGFQPNVGKPGITAIIYVDINTCSCS